VAGLDLPTLVQKIRVDGDTKAAEGQVQSGMSRIGSTMTKAGVAASVGLTVPILAGAYKATQAASDLAESASKVGVVFEGQAPKIRKFAESAATDLGMSEQKALEATGTFGNLFRALDIGTKPAADMSTSLVTLAADLASFNNANPEDVLLALRSGLLGEAEPLRQFGVSLSAARIEAEALASGLVKPTAEAGKVAEAALKVKVANAAAAAALKEHGKGSLEYQKAAMAATKAEEAYSTATKGSVPELTAAQKAQAAYAIIQKDTALAQGDFARTSDGLANQQRILTAQFQDASATMGNLLLPVATKVVKAVNGLLTGFKGLSPTGQKVVAVVAGIAAAAGPLLIIAGKLVKSWSIVSAAFGAGGAGGGAGLMATLGPLLPIIAAVAAAGFLIYKNWDKVRPVLQTVADGARQLFDVLFKGDFKGGPFSEDSPIIDKVFDIRDAVKEVVGHVSAFWKTLTSGFTEDEGTGPEKFALSVRDAGKTIVAVVKEIIAFLGDVVDFVSTHVVPHLVEFGKIVMESIGGAFRWVIDNVVPMVAEFAAFVVSKVSELMAWWETIWPQFSEAVGHVWRAIRTVIETALGILKPLIEGALGFIAALWRAWGDDILSLVRNSIQVIQNVISGAMKVIQGIIQTVLALINGDWGKAWEGVKKILAGAWDIIFGIFRGAANQVRHLMGAIVSIFGEVLRPVGNLLHTWIVTPFEAILAFIGDIPGKITRLASGMFDGIKNAFKAVINFVIDAWNKVDFSISIKAPSWVPGLGGKGWEVDDIVPDIPRVRALGGRGTGAFIAGDRFGPELAPPAGGAAQVLNAERTQRLLRQIADGRGMPTGGSGIYAPISVQTVDRRSGEQLGRDMAWGLSAGSGRPLVGSRTEG
jgi:phage-related protein